MRQGHRTARHERRGIRTLALAVFFALLLGFCVRPALAAEQHVLVLHSYHSGYDWTDGIQKGLSEALAARAPGVELFVEYMDAKRQPPETTFPLLYDLYRLKYRDRRPAVLVASDDAALNFLLAHREKLFPGVPVVACGVGVLTSERIGGQGGYTGVAERTDIPGTIEAALRLMPGLRTVAAVADGTETGKWHMERFRQAMQGYRGRLEAREIAGQTFESTAAALSTLTPDTAVLYLGLLRDPEGKVLTVAESMDFLLRATPQPVFVVWDFLVGRGAVGGVVVSGERQGRVIADMAARILAGERVEDMPFQTLEPTAGLFDYAALKRHGLSPSGLPPGAAVINRPLSFLERNRAALMVAAGVLLGMVLGLSVLLINIERRRRAERERSESRRRFQDFVETMSVGVLELDVSGTIVFANAASHAICGYAPGSLAGRSLLDLAETPFVRGMMQEIMRQGGSPAGTPGSALARLRKQPEGVAEVKVDWLCLRGAEGTCTGFLAAVTDLTDLRLAQREREEGQRFATALLDASPTPIFAINRLRRVVRVNRALEAFLGVRMEEQLGRNVSEIMVLPSASLLEKWDEDLYAKGGLQTIETQITTAGGRQREVTITRGLFLGADGQPAGIVGTITDMTERARMEKALRESREKYRVLFENLPVGVAVEGRDSTLLEVNRALEEQFGKPREGMLGLKPWQLGLNQQAADGSPIMEGQFQGQRAMLERRVVRDTEVLMHTADGRELWTSITAAPLAGAEFGAVVTLVDITERKRMEAELKSRLRAVTSPQGLEEGPLAFTDLFDLADIQAFQDAFATATGVASIISTPEGRAITRPSNFCGPCRDEACAHREDGSCCMLLPQAREAGLLSSAAPIRVGERVIALWHIYQAREAASNLDAMAERLSEAGRPLEAVRRCLDSVPVMSRSRFGEIHASLAQLARQMSELALKNLQQARDIEERQRAQQALEQAKEAAEEASNVKSDFLANVSHEIRTPLHGVLGMLQLMLVTSLDAEQSEYVDKAMYSARSLLSVINDILDFSKIESGKLKLGSEDFDPAALVRASAEVFEDAAKAKGLDLRVEIAADLPVLLRGDPGKIRQILFNLVGNAVKFTESGHIRVGADALAQADGRVVLLLDVEDTGVGIPEDRQSSVFEPFTQGDAVFTKRFQGTGLGLSIVRRLVELMGGSISLDSQTGRGSRFEVALRLEQPASAPAHPAPRRSAPPQLRPLTLLLAEDNLVSQLAAKSFLQRAGHTVDTAMTGQEVLEKLAQKRYDAVLMDIQMPEMDGVEATRRIRAHDDGSWDPNLPVIALTAYAQASEHRAFLEAGMDDAISKPLEMRDILDALARALARREG